MPEHTQQIPVGLVLVLCLVASLDVSLEQVQREPCILSLLGMLSLKGTEEAAKCVPTPKY